jgi:hypothetical protein
VPRSALSRTWLQPRRGLAHRHPASLQSSIHCLPVGRADCQLGCLDVWQKRHARTPSAPPNSALACPGALECASAAPLCVAVRAFSPEAWRVLPPGCTSLLFALTMQRHWNYEVSRRQSSVSIDHSASRAENQAPSGSIRSNFSSRIACTTASSINCRAAGSIKSIGFVLACRAEQRLPSFPRQSGQRPPADLADDAGHLFKR